MRMVSVALRLSGALNIGALQSSFAELVRRHEALRTTIASEFGNPMQRIREWDRYELEVVDLSTLPENRRDHVARDLVEQLVNEPYYVSEGPLFAARLLKLGRDNHVLVVATDHMISDAASMGILFREIFAMYTRVSNGLLCELPKVTIQFADYAAWQHKMHDYWAKAHDAFWMKRIAGARRVRLFVEERRTGGAGLGWAALPIHLGEKLSAGVRALSRHEQTTSVMVLLATYAALVLRLCDASDLLMLFITMGRLRPEVQNTVGFFGAPLFLRVKLLESDSFTDLIARVTKEYATACEHTDSCKVAAQMVHPELLLNPCFNWIPRELNMHPEGQIHPSETGDAIVLRRYDFRLELRNDIEWDGEPRLELSDTKEGIHGLIRYRPGHFAFSTIERFGASFRDVATKLIRDPNGRVSAVSLFT
jgi:hypothetical protein